MKKALAILMVLAAITGVVFAEAAPVAVSGNATLTWGIALDDPAPNGFNNEAEWKVTIPLLTKQTFTKKSDGDAYAEIKINDAVYVIEGDHDGDTAFTAGDKEIDSVSAKLVFGAVTMSIYDKPGFKVNNAELWEPIKADDYYGDSPKEGTDLTFEPGFDGYGTKISYKAEKFEAGVKIGSEMTWERADAVPAVVAAADDPLTAEWDPVLAAAAVPAETRKSKYAIGFDASVTPSEMVTASATFNYASWAATTAVDEDGAAIDGFMSAGVNVVAKPVADVSVSFAVDAGNDYMVDADVTDADPAEQVWAYDARLSATYAKLLELGVYYASAGTPMAGVGDDGEEVSDVAVYAKVMDNGMVPNLSAWATVIVTNLLSSKDFIEAHVVDPAAAPMAFGAGASYKYMMGDVNYVKPFAELFGQNMTQLGASYAAEKGTDIVTVGNVGVVYGLFSNTTVTAKYEAGSTNDDLMHELIAAPSRTTKGVFTLACKVTY